MSSIPTTGDVVVHYIHDAASVSYGLSTFSGSIQFTACSHQLAHGYADRFAKRHRVDVWHTADDQRYSCTAQFRQT
jgi:hypothetical protein